MTGLKTEDELLKWYNEEYCLDQVKQNGNTLQFVKNQTRKFV